MQVVHPSKHKFIVVLVAALVSFLGFEAASLVIESWQLADFFAVSFYVYLFLVFWQTFVFDLHLRHFAGELGRRFAFLTRRQHWLHFQNYLILPGIIYWTTIALVYLNPFDRLLKQFFIIFSTLALALSFWYLKTVFYAHHEAGKTKKQIIFIIKFYASYLAFASAFGVAKFFGYGPSFFALVVFLFTFLLIYQALFQHHYVGFKTLKFLFGAGIFLAVVSFVIFIVWNVNFYSGALVLAAIYNTVWGLVHHKYIDKDLTREVAYEYLAVLFVILVIIFSTTNFAERI